MTASVGRNGLNRTIEKAKERKFWRLPKKGSSPKLEHQWYLQQH